MVLRKLNSPRGASILMALVFFLVCGFVGAVVLGSATANAQKIQDKRAEQQAYFAVSSAARLLQAEWGNSRCTGWESMTEHTCGVHAWDTHTKYRLINQAGEDGFLTGENDNVLTRAAWHIFLENARFGNHRKPLAGDAYETAFTLALEEPEVPQVAGTLTMTKDYHATVVLRLQDSDPEDPANTITLRFAASGGEPEVSVKQPDGQCSYWVSDDSEENGGHKEYRDLKTTTRTTAVIWSGGTIMKGAPKHA